MMNFDDDVRPGRRRAVQIGMLVVLLVVAGGFGLLVMRSKSEARQASAAGPGAGSPGGGAPGGGGSGGGAKGGMGGPMSVAVAQVTAGNIHITLDALGAVTPVATVTVRTQIAGTLENIRYKEGQFVQAGDELADVDPRPYQLALEQDLGQLQRDQALLAQAQKDLVRYQLLVSQDSVAQQTLDNEASLVAQYKGAVQIDQAQIDTAKLNIQYCKITAPVSGRIGLRQVDAGNYVQTGDTNGIVVITQMQPMSVLFTVPEDNVAAIMTRVNAGATLPVTALDRSQSATLATGVLSTVDNQIDPATGTVKIRAVFDNKNNALFPSQFVNIRLLVDTLQNALVIPYSAIQRGQPGTFVYVVQPDSTVKIRVITLGPAEGELVAVTKGLAAGETIVSDGADKLKDGAKVVLPSAAKTGDAAPADAKTAPADAPAATGHHGHRRHTDNQQQPQ